MERLDDPERRRNRHAGCGGRDWHPLTTPFWIDWSTRAGPTTTATAPMVIWASTMTTRLYATRSIAGGRPGVLRRLPGDPADQAGHDVAEQPMGQVEVHEAARCRTAATWPLQSGKPLQTQPAPSARVSPPTTSSRYVTIVSDNTSRQ